MSQGLVTVSYIGATILFILSLGGLSNPETAKRGNIAGMVGMGIAIATTLALATPSLGAFGLWEMLIFASAVFVSFVYLIGNGALNWGPVKQLNPMRDVSRTTSSTVRKVGAEGRVPPVEQGAA